MFGESVTLLSEHSRMVLSVLVRLKEVDVDGKEEEEGDREEGDDDGNADEFDTLVFGVEIIVDTLAAGSGGSGLGIGMPCFS